MRIPTILAIVLITACSSATKTSAGDPCAALPGDTLYTALRPAYRECSVSSKAVQIQPAARPDFTPDTRSMRSACYSAELEFVVNEVGVIETQTARLIRTNNTQYGDAVMNVLPAWRFQPAQKDGKPVRQITVYKSGMETRVVAVPAGSSPSRASPGGGSSRPSC